MKLKRVFALIILACIGLGVYGQTTVTVSSTEPDPTNSTSFSVTIVFSSAVTDFVVGDISVTNGSASNLNTSDNITYTADITPSADGTVSVQVPADVTTTGTGGNNSASNILTREYDSTDPSISSVTIPDAAMNVGDVVTATITVTSDT
ncbi:MAG: hypothetical protein K9J30_13825 [Bacteroidales bacterium]|nr:hypothetical protein [Bacteroidales bacterium]